MSEVVWKAGVRREKGFLYYLSDNAVVRAPMMQGDANEPEVVCRGDFEREAGYLYFLDKDGNVARALLGVDQPASRMPRSEVVWKTGAPREAGYFYFVRERSVMRAPYAHSSEPEEVCALEVDKEPGYLYFVDADGDVRRLKKSNF